ncbi:hypothetical protein [Desulforhopalus sp. 52FAK]
MITIKSDDEIEVEIVKGAWIYIGNTSNGDGLHLQWEEGKSIAGCCELAEEIAQKVQLLYDKIHTSA